jgi:multidrug resistance efflux pump
MVAALVITIGYVFLVWLVFFKYKIAKFNFIWGIATFWVGVHLLLVFLIGMRFSQPYTKDARIVRHTIQVVPRLPEPTLLTDVLVEPNVPAKKGDPLFRFDDRLYRYRVNELEAELVAAKQHVEVLSADVETARQKIEVAKANVILGREQVARYTALAAESAGRVSTLQEWQDKLAVSRAQEKEAQANLRAAQAKFDSQINGVNTTVASVEAKLAEAKYFLEQTTIYAPEDGFITNLQARPGLVVGIVRLGAIASYVVDEDLYVLAPIVQEHLKFVEENQPIEIALDLYPGRILTGRVEQIWWATGQGQMLPEGRLPNFVRPLFKGKFAVRISIDNPDGVRLPAGAQGAAAIYTDVGKGFSPLRRIVIRTYTWSNWLYLLPI